MVRNVVRLVVAPFVAGLLFGGLAALPDARAADACSLAAREDPVASDGCPG